MDSKLQHPNNDQLEPRQCRTGELGKAASTTLLHPYGQALNLKESIINIPKSFEFYSIFRRI